jgi:hypothetical protein
MTTLAPAGTNDYVLTSQGAAAPQWKDVTTLVPAAVNYWQLANHVLAPANAIDYDLAVGGNSTASAKLLINAATGNLTTAGTASVSGNLTLGNGSAIQSAYGPLVLNYKSGANTWSEALRITESGKIGIGTTTPYELLHISSTTDPTFRIDPGNNINVDPTISLRDTIETAGFDIRYDNDIGATYFDNLYDNAAGDIFFRTRTAGTAIDVMTLDASGNVGIGTTNPSAKLQVALTDSAPTSTGFLAQNTGGSQLIINAVDRDFSAAGNWTGTNWSVTGGVLQHTTGNTTSATLTSGFMTTGSIINGRTYALTFTVSGMTAGTITPYIGTVAGTVQSANGTYTVYISANANDANLIFTPSNTFDGALDNISLTRVTNYLALSNNGKLGIGLNNPSYMFDLTDNTVTGGRIMNISSQSITTGVGLYMNLGTTSVPFTGNFVNFLNNSSARFTVDYRGGITNTYTTPYTTGNGDYKKTTYLNTNRNAYD